MSQQRKEQNDQGAEARLLYSWSAYRHQQPPSTSATTNWKVRHGAPQKCWEGGAPREEALPFPHTSPYASLPFNSAWVVSFIINQKQTENQASKYLSKTWSSFFIDSIFEYKIQKTPCHTWLRESVLTKLLKFKILKQQQNYPWTTNLQGSLQTIQKQLANTQTLSWSYQMMRHWQPNKLALLKNGMKNHLYRKCTVKMLAFKRYHKMLYKNKFFMKNDKEIEKISPFAIAKKHAEVNLTKNAEDHSVEKWKLLVKDIKGDVTKWGDYMCIDGYLNVTSLLSPQIYMCIKCNLDQDFCGNCWKSTSSLWNLYRRIKV